MGMSTSKWEVVAGLRRFALISATVLLVGLEDAGIYKYVYLIYYVYGKWAKVLKVDLNHHFQKNIKVIPTILFVGVVGKEGFVITVT
tara:strand:+ start:938 stop:1198 length:261 start_codon:yes stop_codon:yes gene_type:complete